MKAAALAAIMLGLLAAPSAVRFEADGVRVDGSLVQGAVLQFKEAGGASLLVSGTVIEPLAAALEIEAAPGLTLTLEPGVRAEKKGQGVVLTTHGRRAILVGDVSLESPVTLEPSAAGWKAGDISLAGASMRVRLQAQDPDANLDALKEASKKIQQAREGRPAGQTSRQYHRRVKPRVRRVFGEDPFVSAEAVDSPTLRFLQQISPSGN